jgi:hypothetical protein
LALTPKLRKHSRLTARRQAFCFFNCSERDDNTGIIALARRADANDEPMKKGNKNNDSEMQAEYDFSPGVRGKYARRYAEDTNVVVLDPDVAKLFPNAEAVNKSLRNLAKTIRRRKSVVAK